MSRHPTARTGKTMLGRYRIERELGRGGMGVVYVATDVNTGRLVALKTTTVAGLGSGEKTRNQRRERFIREVRALTQVNHENVVHVFDAGEVDDPDLGWLLFYTMDYVEGTTLANLVQERGALTGGEAAAVVSQVAHGLGEAHRQGIIHRDVKPANIFLSNDGRALIGDFGIAKIEGSTQITRRDQLVGTPNYLAPEQILGEAVGPWTDVFALGALFYVITQNRPLRQQVDAGALLASANSNEPVQRVLAAQGLPDGLKQVVARALERDPNRRYVDGTAFADALANHATRVPPLSPEQARPTFLNEGTLDRSSAFASASMPSADAADVNSLPDGQMPGFGGGDPNSVEAMAMAMLGEVERRATGTFKQPDKKDIGAAPAELPVARTETTQVVKRTAITMEPVTDEEPEEPEAPAPSPARGQRAQRALAQEQTAPTVTAPLVVASPVVQKAEAALVAASPTSPPGRLILERVAGIPRPVRLVAAFGIGAVLGLTVAIAGAPPDVLASSAPSDFAPVPLRARPAMCPDVASSPEAQSRGALILDEARTLLKEGARKSAILDKLREGIAVDPTNHEIFYLLGRNSEAGSQQDDADECVCQIKSESVECRKIDRLR